MELPRKILIGNDVIYQLGTFIRDLNHNATIVVVISGNTVKTRVGKEGIERVSQILSRRKKNNPILL